MLVGFNKGIDHFHCILVVYIVIGRSVNKQVVALHLVHKIDFIIQTQCNFTVVGIMRYLGFVTSEQNNASVVLYLNEDIDYKVTTASTYMS